MTKKDEQILEHARKTGTPIFILTAKDKLSIPILFEYWRMDNNKQHAEAVRERITEFQQWQYDNPDKVKSPD